MEDITNSINNLADADKLEEARQKVETARHMIENAWNQPQVPVQATHRRR